MAHNLRFIVLFITTILVDGFVLTILGSTFDTMPFLHRLISLGAGVLLSLLVARMVPFGHSPSVKAGFWPLIGVCLLVNYGLFVLLAVRTPQIQPLVHLTLAWTAASIFFAIGMIRIRRRDD